MNKNEDISPTTRVAKIIVKRIKKNKNPFKYKAKSSKAKHVWLRKRHAREARFKMFSMLASFVAVIFLISLLYGLIASGYKAFIQTQLQISVDIPSDVNDTNIDGLYKKSLLTMFPDVTNRRDKIKLYRMVSQSASYKIADVITENPDIAGKSIEIWVPASSDIDMYVKDGFSRAENGGKITDKQILWLEELNRQGRIRNIFNSTFFTSGDSREPEQAGILTAMVGSLLTILVCMACALPLGVACAIYLEEFMEKSWFASVLEVNINNLAAVPSIIFGLLGLSIYLNFFDITRSSSLVGGLTLALLVLPIIIITSRNSLRAVPSSMRDAAVALGASKVETVFQHILPYSLPGIMTGIVLSIARALGETAPLLMIGMVAFIVDIPASITDPATSLPVQIYLWSDNPELGFAERVSAAILVLLTFLVSVNVCAVYLRNKFKIQW